MNTPSKTKRLKTQPRIVRDVRLCTDEDGSEAIYIDGSIVYEENTIYLYQVAEVIGKKAASIRHHSVSTDGKWPDNFSQLTLID